MSPKHYYAMRLWKMDVPVPVEGWIELVVRCWGESKRGIMDRKPGT
jgi:sulfite oxidase